MEAAALMLATILGPFYLVLGVSRLLYAKAWIKLAKGWRTDHLSLFGTVMFFGVFGLIIINMYNVWTWDIWLLITLSGWAMAIKAAAYMLLPGSAVKGWLKMGEATWLQYLGGIVGVVIGLVLIYFGYMVY
ncbi:MAG: hypothetical protein WC604_01440 [Candidatus Gracilibacteria bacterium]